MIKENDTVKVTRDLGNGVREGALATVLLVHEGADLAYEIEVVDLAGETIFLGPVDADAVGPLADTPES